MSEDRLLSTSMPTTSSRPPVNHRPPRRQRITTRIVPVTNKSTTSLPFGLSSPLLQKRHSHATHRSGRGACRNPGQILNRRMTVSQARQSEYQRSNCNCDQTTQVWCFPAPIVLRTDWRVGGNIGVTTPKGPRGGPVSPQASRSPPTS